MGGKGSERGGTGAQVTGVTEFTPSPSKKQRDA
jgi:hypothetical protein